ncbi:unnamed protein product [Dracunculus medinensis]|uniref:Disintegrin domain-containing protein n=1 Tax=Dracunculus medinensis TaxID=318479 RepID=A0A3P7PAU5_DRAME|nr:unnamed protein product [Dracunculus medinensis]
MSTNKEFISRLGDRKFEVVHPFQIRDKNDRIGIDTRNYYLNGSVHYKQVIIVVRTLSVGRLKLLVRLNELIFVNESDFKKFDDVGERLLSQRAENCYYQGSVNGEESSFVALSSCNGLRGIIGFVNGTAYGIWPLDGGDRGRRHPHVFYQTTWTRTANSGTQIKVANNNEFGNNLKIKKRDVTRQTKYIELSVIGTHSFMKEHGYSDIVATEFMLEAVNVADLIFSRELNVRLSVIYSELWIDTNRIDVTVDIERTLSGVIEYVTGHLYHIVKDVTIVFTADKFANNEVSSCAFGSICTSRAAGIITAIDFFTVHDTGQVLAHNLAHSLGIDYDKGICLCEMDQCLMNRQIGSYGSPFIWQFSRCTLARMHGILQTGHLQCLLNRPLEASPLRQCGNGIVDGEEECDCGRRDDCQDPCCDPLTCTLRAHAQCATHQPCCYRCQFRPAGHICRAPRSSCDIAEVCSGDDGNCPSDGYLIDGTVCGLNGHCWKGNCSDMEQQCRNLWGNESTLAVDHCFERNVLGVEYANCGVDAGGGFRKCAPDDIRCGTLQCRGGQQSPLDQSLSSFSLQFLHDSKQIQCKVITNSEAGIVSDGSSCGSSKVCIQGVCLPLLQVSSPVHCPTNNLAYHCSGHGDCTTTQHCLCFVGWSGFACDIRSNTSVSSSTTALSPFDDLFIPLTVGHTLHTTTLLAILLLVGIFLLMLLVCLLFCYRRRSDVEFSSSANEKLNDSIPEIAQRSIKFGNMPSYREEKRKRKKDKRVYDALHRINEASDERDSISLKSRDSASNRIGNESASFNFKASPNLVRNGGAIMLSSHGSQTLILNENSPRHKLLIGCDYYNRSPCSEILASPSRCSVNAHGEIRYDRTHNGYATDSELGMNHYSRYMNNISPQLDLSPSSQASTNRLAPTPLKLNNIGMLLRQLKYTDENTSDSGLGETERINHINWNMNNESSCAALETEENCKMSIRNEEPVEMYNRKHNDDRYDGIVFDNRRAIQCNFSGSSNDSIGKSDTKGINFHQANSLLNEVNKSERQSLFTDSFKLDL